MAVDAVYFPDILLKMSSIISTVLMAIHTEFSMVIGLEENLSV